jgi:hypothetical protein
LVDDWPPEKNLTLFSFRTHFSVVHVFPGESRKWSAETIKDAWARINRSKYIREFVVVLLSLSNYASEIIASISQHFPDITALTLMVRDHDIKIVSDAML